MTIRTMNRLLSAVALGLAVAGGNVVAAASVRLPAEQMNGTPSLAPILKQVKAAVVTVAITGHSGPEKNSSLNNGQRPRRFTSARDAPAERQIKASGSGVVIDAKEGLIFTNSHVIDHADEISVTLPDGRELPAKRVGSDRGTDVAVIKVQAQNLTALPIGDSEGLEVGDFVLAIGNPYQIGQTVTSGIISGLHRRNVGIEEYEDFIQTDAAIYPGNSGGALVNLDGKLIGINTAFIGATSTNPGMGFAIPINMVRSIADQLLQYGEVRRGRLGITFEEPTPTLIRSMKLSASTTGPVIVKVEKGSPAEGAGLKVGDVVSELARISVRNRSDLNNRMGLLSVGDVANLTVVRDGKPMIIRATIADQEKRIRSK
jgi:serine protease DegQ